MTALTVTLRPGYLARYVTLSPALAFPSGFVIQAVDDNGTAHHVTAPPFTTMEAAAAWISQNGGPRIWATPAVRSAGVYMSPAGTARVVGRAFG